MKIRPQNRISPKAALPFNFVKGSFEQRNHKAQQYWNTFVNEYKRIKKPNIEDYRMCINDTLAPNRVRYKVMKETNEDNWGSVGMGIRVEQNALNRYIINHRIHKIRLPIDDDGVIQRELTAVHEARHFFDHLFNPKISLIRVRQLTNKKEYNNDVNDLRDVILGTFFDEINKKGVKKKFEKILAKLPNDVAIEALQSIRYSLLTEKNAYLAEVKYLLDKNPITNVFRAIEANIAYKICHFSYREKLVKQKIKELISAEREAHQHNLEKNNKNKRI